MKKTWINLFLIFFASALQAQNLDKLYRNGFENIQVWESRDTIKVFFEHREYRNPFHSMYFADLLTPEIKEKELVWVPVYHNRPIGNYSSGSYEFSPLSRADRIFFSEENQLFKGYRFHFRIHPEFIARFGYYDHPFQIKFNLILDTRIYLAPGLSLQTGISFPLENSLDAQDMEPRIAPSMLHYFLQPVNSHFFAFSAGTFYYDRYGVDLQYRYYNFENPWSFGIESGITGFQRFNSGSFYTESMNDIYFVGDAEYRLPFDNLSFKLSLGQFLFDDKGVRFDLLKQFGTVDVGLHAAYTEAGASAGFQLAFSLWPGTIYRSKKIELRTTEEFRWEYSYNNEDPVARKFRLGTPRLSDILRQYHESFIQNSAR